MDSLEEFADFERSSRRSVAQQQSVWGSALLLAAIITATILVTRLVHTCIWYFGPSHWYFGWWIWNIVVLVLTIIITATILLTSLDCLTGKYLQQLILSFKGSTANDMGIYGYGARSLISFKH